MASPEHFNQAFFLKAGGRLPARLFSGLFCAVLLLSMAGCQSVQQQKVIDPKTIDTSTTAGLIRKLQAENSTPAKNENLRYIGFLIADYGTSMTSQVVNDLLQDDGLTSYQRIWLQEIRIDMGRALVGCAANPSPAANIFQELFIFKVAYLIAKRDAPKVLKDKGQPLIDKLKLIQDVIWGKVKEGVDASLDPLDADVSTWMKEYGNDTHRFWWPREVGLLMSLESVDNLQFTGMLASVERANEGIDQLNKTFETTQFLVERLPMLSSWEFELAVSKVLADPAISGLIDSFKSVSDRMARLESTVNTNFARLAGSLNDFSAGFNKNLEGLNTGMTDLAGILRETRDRLSTSLSGLEKQIETQNGQLVTQLAATSENIGQSSQALAETVSRLDATIVKQEARVEKIADEIRSELAGQTNEVLDRATFRIGMAVGIGVLSSLLIAGVLGLVALRTGLLGRKN